jgi:hypothetical protein
MRPASPLLSFLFVVYCLEMGIFLLLWPWSGAWDRVWSQIPWHAARLYGLSPLVRSLVSGFGVVHLVWGAHDCELWLRRFRQDREP